MGIGGHAADFEEEEEKLDLGVFYVVFFFFYLSSVSVTGVYFVQMPI